MNKRFVFDKINVILLIVGIVMLILGYGIMSRGDIVLSPIILALAYLIVFPAAIGWGTIFGKKKSTKYDEEINLPAKITKGTKK